MKNLLNKYRHAWLLLYFAIYLPWFFWLEKAVAGDYHVIHVRLDDWIPFNEYFIIPYLSWFFYIGIFMAYFFFTNKKDFYRCCAYLYPGMTICLIIYTVFHNGIDLRPVVDPGKNFCSWLVAMLHKVDTSTNTFPSIHVFNAVAMHITIVRSETLGHRRGVRAGSLVLCVLICLSTVFLKQHSVADIVGALVLIYLLYPLVYGSSGRSYEVSEKKFTRKALG